MRIYDSGKILAGLLLFLALVTSPVWYNLAIGGQPAVPDPQLPRGETACVAARQVMVESHMTMLNSWRDDAVRGPARKFVAVGGKSVAMSLSQGCMGCHRDRAEFCDRCHNYAGVSPDCWDCHVAPQAK